MSIPGRRVRGSGASLLLAGGLTACALNAPTEPPILVSSSTPSIQSQRERGYIACASALIRAHPRTSRLYFRRGYQSKVREDQKTRLFRLGAWVSEAGERKPVQFECVTGRYGNTRVLSLVKLSVYPFED